MMKFKKGESVRQVVTPVEGKVVGLTIVDDDHVQYLVETTGEDGEPHQVYFKEDDLESVE